MVYYGVMLSEADQNFGKLEEKFLEQWGDEGQRRVAGDVLAVAIGMYSLLPIFSDEGSAIAKRVRRMTGDNMKSLFTLFRTLASANSQTGQVDPALNHQMQEAERALGLLIQRSQDDSWLGQFLSQNSPFTEAIGGWPDWLPKPTQSEP